MIKRSSTLIAGISALALIVTITLTAGAQNSNAGFTEGMKLGTVSNERLPLAIKNYRMGMNSENDGLVESSLYYAVRLRIAYPETDLTELETVIDDLVTEGRTQSIRYLAYLASTLFASPSLVDRETLEHTEDIPTFFGSVSEQLQNRLIVRNN